ncbi:hypothetical protein [Tenacibaculum ovolyticum]|nr:hypothetical protein [Tenacibaculum ovolyticum]
MASATLADGSGDFNTSRSLDSVFMPISEIKDTFGSGKEKPTGSKG